MSNLNAFAKDFVLIMPMRQLSKPKEQATHQLRLWNFSIKYQNLVVSLLNEWYTGRTLNTVLQQ